MKKNFGFLILALLSLSGVAHSTNEIGIVNLPLPPGQHLNWHHLSARAWHDVTIQLSGHLTTPKQIPKEYSKNPEQFLSSYHYTPCGKLKCVTFDYNIPAIQDLFSKLNINFWPQPRPQVLTWIFYSNNQHNVPINNQPKYLKTYKYISQLRGLEFVLPTFDLIDTQLITDKRGRYLLATDRLFEASQRYQIPNILIGVINPTTQTARWTLLDHQETFEWEIQASKKTQNQPRLLENGLNHVADHFANKTAQDNVKLNQTIVLAIHPITTINQLNQLTEHLENLPYLSNLQIKRIDQDYVFIQANRHGSSDEFTTQITKDPKLNQDTEANLTSAAIALKWLPT